MPALRCTPLATQPLELEALATLALGASAEPSVTTLVELPPASVFAAGPEVPHYWAARSGRAGSNYAGAYLLLGEDYVWWTLDGAGIDPGLFVDELDGLTGHEVELEGGQLDGGDVATPTAAVIEAIPGWGCSADGAILEVEGPAAVTTGTTWDAADAGAMVGMRSSTGAGSPIEGPVTTVLAQHLPDPGLALPVLAVDVLIGTVADNADRWSLALFTAAGGTTTPAGETLLVDLGQLPADQVQPNAWARVYLPSDVLVTADQAMWLGIKGELGQTYVGGRLTGDSLRGDWTAQNLQEGDAGEDAIDPDASVPWPSTWTGTTSAQNAFVCGARLVVGRSVGDASHHSEADPAVFGVHAPVGDLGSSIDLNSHLFMVQDSPPFLGMVGVDIGWAVGLARGTQPSLALMTGADTSDPDAPEIDGATVLHQAGQLTGSSTLAWENRSLGGVAIPASTAIAWAAKCNDDTTGTTIAFAQDPSQANADPPEAPMDWLPVESDPGPAQGSEVEIFPGSSDYDETDPTTPFESPVVEPSPARPRNVPGARIRYRIPGITVAS